MSRQPGQPDSVRRRVVYAGRVQGVGFRYTTCQVAADYRVTGYVRNLPDGRVEVVAEGTAAELDVFIEALSHRMDRYIEQREVESLSATGEYSQFGVRF